MNRYHIARTAGRWAVYCLIFTTLAALVVAAGVSANAFLR